MVRAAFAALLSILFASSLLAGAEVPLSAASRQRAPFHQRGPRIATDGTDFLVVWADGRVPDGSVPLYVTRVGADGRALDAASLLLRRPNVTIGGYAVTWTGNVYLVLWIDWERRTLQWVRIDREGRLLDEQPREIAGITTPHGIASVNGRSLLVFTGESPATRLYGQFIEADGTAAGARITFPHKGRSDWAPRVATNGDGFYVAWNRAIGTRVDIVGIPVALDGTLGSERTFGTGGEIHLASNGTDYLLAWQASDTSVVTEHLDTAGTTRERTTHAVLRSWSGVTLAPYGSGYLFVTREATNAEGRVLDAAGRETGRVPLDASGTFYMSMAIATNPNATVAVWYEDFEQSASGSEVFAEPVDGTRDRVLLSESAPRQTALRIATNGNGYLGAWIETRERAELRVGRASASGVPLDGEGIFIAGGVTHPPALTYDGANYVLAWNEENTSGACAVRLARITHEGLVLDGDRIVSRTCTSSLGLGSNGQESLLVRSTTELDSATNRFRTIFIANHVARDLSLGTAVELPADRRARDIAVGSLPGTWLVAWTRYTDNDDCGMCNPPSAPTYDVNAVRLSSDLSLLDTQALMLTETTVDRAPSIAAAGNDFLVVWERLSDETIRARRVPRFGAPSDELVVTTGRGPSVVARGGEFMIAFEDDGNLFATTPGAPGRTIIASSIDVEHSVRLVETTDGLTAAYLRVASEPLYNYVDRGFLRMLDATPRRRAIRRR